MTESPDQESAEHRALRRSWSLSLALALPLLLILGCRPGVTAVLRARSQAERTARRPGVGARSRRAPPWGRDRSACTADAALGAGGRAAEVCSSEGVEGNDFSALTEWLLGRPEAESTELIAILDADGRVTTSADQTLDEEIRFDPPLANLDRVAFGRPPALVGLARGEHAHASASLLPRRHRRDREGGFRCRRFSRSRHLPGATPDRARGAVGGRRRRGSMADTSMWELSTAGYPDEPVAGGEAAPAGLLQLQPPPSSARVSLPEWLQDVASQILPAGWWSRPCRAW